MAIRLQSDAHHVVAIPYPAQGHVGPMFELCQRLVTLGFTFTFVNTHHIHQRLQGGYATAASDNHSLGTQDEQLCQSVNNGNSHHDSRTHAVRQQEKVRFDMEIAHDGASDSKNKAVHQTSKKTGRENGCANPIEMVFVEGGRPPEDHARLATKVEAYSSAQSMKEAVEQLISNLLEKRRIVFLLTDIFLSWSRETASSFSLPWVSFCSSSASSFAGLVHFGELADQGKCLSPPDNQETDFVVVEGIPGLPPTYLGDILKVWDAAGRPLHEFFKPFLGCRWARFILFNTFEQLEGEVLQELRKRQYAPLAVGPLLPFPYLTDTTHTYLQRGVGVQEAAPIRASLFKEDRTCLDWLSGQLPLSVLFIAFGSISLRTDEQQQELSDALEAVGCPYLWVRKPDIAAGASTEGAAAGKVERCGRGLIVPWAPQLDVLSHPAVGGFLTHCGWNSVVEALAFGVPMLCWADMGERLLSQRLVVQIWKCGLDMVMDGRRYKQHVDEAVVVKSGELEKPIRRLMVEDEGACLRAQAARQRDAAIVAIRQSHSNLDTFATVMHEVNRADASE